MTEQPVRRRQRRVVVKMTPEAFDAELGRRLRALDRADRAELNEMKVDAGGRRILSLRRPCVR